MKKRLKVLLLFIIIIFLMLILQANKQNKKDLKSIEIYEQVKTEMLYTRDQRIEGINKLNKILKESKYLDSELKLKIISELGKIYALNGDYLNSVENLITGIDLAVDLGDKYMVCKNIINLSTEFINLKGYATAIEALNYGLNIKIDDEKQNNKIKEYIYINLADIYSRKNELDKAKEYLNRAKLYTSKISEIDKHALSAITIIESNILFKENKIEEASRLLDTIDNNKENLIVIDELIPYLQLKAKIEFYYGNNEEGMDIAKTVFELCRSEQQPDIELYLMEDIVDNLVKNDNPLQKEITEEYRKSLLSLYENSTSDKNRSSVFYIIKNIDSKISAINNLKNKIKLQTLLIIFIIVFFILILKLYKIKNQNNIDGLTSINNRKYYDYIYKKYMYSNTEFGLIILDIDHFKSINDNYGHIFGDEVIKEISKTIKNNLSRNEMVFRYGGEEFCIICKKESFDKVVQRAEDIRLNIESLNWENNITVTVSLGVAFKNKSCKDDILAIADKNLYISKSSGRNKVTC